MATTEDLLRRWTLAGVLDAATADRIRDYEKTQEQSSGLRWQVMLALIFGAMLLAAGIALFVAAHWDELSPSSRFVIVIGMLVLLHGAALAAHDRFERLAMVLHGVGTVAAGAAFALVGQIFNLQEHWPTGILLWALCAIAGWALLGDELQQTIAILLVPAWILGEWWARTAGYRGSDLYGARMLATFAALYLTAFVGSRKRLVFALLFSAASIALAVSIVILMGNHSLWYNWQAEPEMLRITLIAGWGWIAVVPLLAAWRLRPSSIAPVVVVLLTAIVLPHLTRVIRYAGPQAYSYEETSVVAYLWVGLLAAFFAWWGVREPSQSLVNYGIITFALTVLWFYFSNVMDKLDRSLSLILLGVLFLGGGWLLEKMRRRLVARVKETV